jgi:hypothetical protein
MCRMPGQPSCRIPELGLVVRLSGAYHVSIDAIDRWRPSPRGCRIAHGPRPNESDLFLHTTRRPARLPTGSRFTVSDDSHVSPVAAKRAPHRVCSERRGARACTRESRTRRRERVQMSLDWASVSKDCHRPGVPCQKCSFREVGLRAERVCDSMTPLISLGVAPSSAARAFNVSSVPVTNDSYLTLATPGSIHQDGVTPSSSPARRPLANASNAASPAPPL